MNSFTFFLIGIPFSLSWITFNIFPYPPLTEAMPPRAPRRAAPGPMAAGVALTLRAPPTPDPSGANSDAEKALGTSALNAASYQ